MSEQIDVIPLETYLDDQAEKLTDLCTRCGKCVEVCPAIREGSPMLAEAEPASVIGDVVDLLKGGPGSDRAATWAETCTGSGDCISHCPESINPRLMLSIALNRVRARKTARGENPTGDFYGRMSQIIKFAVGMQMSPVQYQRITGRAGNAEQADVVFYLGCNRTSWPERTKGCRSGEARTAARADTGNAAIHDRSPACSHRVWDSPVVRSPRTGRNTGLPSVEGSDSGGSDTRESDRAVVSGSMDRVRRNILGTNSRFPGATTRGPGNTRKRRDS